MQVARLAWFCACLSVAHVHAQAVAVLELREPPQLVMADGERLSATVGAATVADGVLDLRDPSAVATFGPHAALGVSSAQSFSFAIELRTKRAEFGTIVMSRDGGAVHFSLVMGRQPGHVSLELWSWARDRLASRARLDDGQWHRIEAGYDAASRQMALVVDGQLDGVVAVREAFVGSPRPRLRLGQNLDDGVQQPFGGEVRGFALRADLPPAFAAHAAREATARCLAAGAAETAVLQWWDGERQARPPLAKDSADWDAQAAALRARVQDACGLWPPPYSGHRLAGGRSPLSGANDARATAFSSFSPQLPLDVREGGTLTRERHSVTRIYFQTFAGWFAGGWLYRPQPQPVGKLPAVLCPHGHWQDGARHKVVQSRCVALAQQGYVVLAVDSVHLEDDRIGLSSLSVMTWNNLRGLELLRSLPQVDAARIGCTGASGGGQQTYYLTALDSGLAAAVPAVMACHFEDILNPNEVHCHCNHTPHLLRAADMPQMAAAFAPRPQLFLTVSGDWTRRFHEHGYPQVGAIYDLYGARAQVDLQRWHKGHDYDQPMREVMYAFFARTLKGEAGAAPKEPPGGAPVETVSALRALERSDVPTPTRAVVDEFMARLAAPRGRNADDVRTSLAALFVARPGSAAPRALGEFVRDDLRGERWLVPSEAPIDLPAILLRPAAAVAPPRAVILLSERGKAHALDAQAPLLRELLARGLAVLLADVRYVGELDVGRSWRELHGRFCGSDEGVAAVRDLGRLVDALPAMQLAPSPVVCALGDRGAVALFAAALDARIAGVSVAERGADYRAAPRTPKIARILLHGDLDDAERAIAPRPVSLLAPSADALAALFAVPGR